MWWERQNDLSDKKWMQQTNVKRIEDKAQLGGKRDIRENVQEIEICSYY